MNQRLLLIAAGLLVIAPPSGAKEPVPYPDRPVRLIVPAIPGTPPDIVGRIIAEKLTATLGQSIVLDNRPGATGLIGLQAIATSAPDGYTLGMLAMPYVVMAAVVPRASFDIKDFAAVVLTNWQYSILAVPAGSRMHTVDDVIAAAKEAPGALKFSSSGNGTPGDIASRLFQRDANLLVTHVPYKGAPAAVLALLTGEVDATISAVGALSAHIKAHKVRALATTAPQRISAYPDLPTFAELGYRGVQVRDWQGVVAPPHTPKHLIALLHAAIETAIQAPDVRERLETLGMEVATGSSEQFAAHIRSEAERWSKLVRDMGLKTD